MPEKEFLTTIKVVSRLQIPLKAENAEHIKKYREKGHLLPAKTVGKLTIIERTGGHIDYSVEEVDRFIEIENVEDVDQIFEDCLE